MDSFPCLRSTGRSFMPVALFSVAVLLTGCAKPPAPQPLVGDWTGTMMTGTVTVPARWEIRADGTAALTLTLPQGAATAQGTWAAHSGTLTQRTTARVVTLGGEPKVMPLASPMETSFVYRVTGDTLMLIQAGTRQSLVLVRDKKIKERRPLRAAKSYRLTRHYSRTV